MHFSANDDFIHQPHTGPFLAKGWYAEGERSFLLNEFCIFSEEKVTPVTSKFWAEWVLTWMKFEWGERWQPSFQQVCTPNFWMMFTARHDGSAHDKHDISVSVKNIIQDDLPT